MSIRERLSGNEAAATAMKQINPDVVAAFPVGQKEDAAYSGRAYLGARANRRARSV